MAIGVNECKLLGKDMKIFPGSKTPYYTSQNESEDYKRPKRYDLFSILMFLPLLSNTYI